jgi:hypothetical protein
MSRTPGRRYRCRHPPPHDCTAAQRKSYNFRTDNLRQNVLEFSSVADLGGLSGIRQQEKEEGKNKLVILTTIFYSHKFHKMENHLVFCEQVQKKV